METQRIKLEPLSKERIPELFEAIGADPEIYRWLPYATPTSLSEFATNFESFIEDSAAGIRVAYAVILKSTGKAIGTTSFLDINATQNSIEIGSTLYARDYWRSFVNTECKILMLTEAFDIRGVERVTIKTDSRNERSRAAILRLGATFEGVLRHHMRRPDGSWRDSAYHSILREEWPAVKENLYNKLAQFD